MTDPDLWPEEARAIAHAAGVRAGNASAVAAGRPAWDWDHADTEVARAEMARVLDELAPRVKIVASSPKHRESA